MVGVGSSHARASLRSRVERRRRQIEQALLARVYGVADPTQVTDADYVSGFRDAASAAVDFALAILEEPEARPPLIPPVLLSQARLAARNGVGIDIVLRRYTAGHAILLDFFVTEVQAEELLAPAELRRMLVLGSSGLDHLLASVSEEYNRELRSRHTDSVDRRRFERVERLLAGELDSTGIEYDFEGCHVALVGRGADVSRVMRALPNLLDCRLLHVSRDDIAWGWLGARRPLDPAEVLRELRSLAGCAAIAVGEAGKAMGGWRLSHRQAEAAQIVLRHRGGGLVRYAEVALLASMLQDDLLQTSLHELYLAPLELERDGGAALRATLRAYFAAGRNVSSAAAALAVDRRTVTNRLHTVGSRLPRPFDAALPDIEAALSLYGHGNASAQVSPSAKGASGR